ncbi:MAG: CvpA family protein [Chloroflexi bacterium]|nr:CvpA family protein [Chloroflexota bacterium]
MLADHWLELVLAALAVLSVANAVRRGFLREGSLLGGLVLALALAHQWYRPLARLTAGSSPQPNWTLAVFLGLVLVVLVAVAALSALAMPLVRRGFISTLDRFGGLLLGCGEGLLVAGLAAELAARFLQLQLPPHSPARVAQSVATSSLAWIAGTLPAEAIRFTTFGT